MQGQDVAPEYAQWRVGPDGIQIKDLRIAAIEQVSAGSWQVRLFYKPPSKYEDSSDRRLRLP